jgi:hypothetical protein
MSPRKAIRSRKARMRTTCPACRGPILPGQRITSENRQPFVHIQCFLADRLLADPFPERRAGLGDGSHEVSAPTTTGAKRP